MKNVVLFALVVLVVIFIVYQYNPSLFHMSEGFADGKSASTSTGASTGAAKVEDKKDAAVKKENKEKFEDKEKFADKKEGFADLSAYEGPAQFGSSDAPAGCYPRDQLTPSELLPKDMSSVWAEQNPMGPGSLKGKNFLSAGALIGVNTVGQSMRNANLQVRSEPPCPQVAVSIFNQSTISPDISHRPLEIGA